MVNTYISIVLKLDDPTSIDVETEHDVWGSNGLRRIGIGKIVDGWSSGFLYDCPRLVVLNRLKFEFEEIDKSTPNVGPRPVLKPLAISILLNGWFAPLIKLKRNELGSVMYPAVELHFTSAYPPNT